MMAERQCGERRKTAPHETGKHPRLGLARASRPVKDKNDILVTIVDGTTQRNRVRHATIHETPAIKKNGRLGHERDRTRRMKIPERIFDAPQVRVQCFGGVGVRHRRIHRIGCATHRCDIHPEILGIALAIQVPEIKERSPTADRASVTHDAPIAHVIPRERAQMRQAGRIPRAQYGACTGAVDGVRSEADGLQCIAGATCIRGPHRAALKDERRHRTPMARSLLGPFQWTSAVLVDFKRPCRIRLAMDEAFFKARYESDAANRAKQSWKDYAEWVRVFYEGKRFPPVPGWGNRETEILAKLPSNADAALKNDLSETGRRLAAEWAKDNSVRKVSTSDLQTWGKRFGDAARDPAALRTALDEVRAELQKRGA